MPLLDDLVQEKKRPLLDELIEKPEGALVRPGEFQPAVQVSTAVAKPEPFRPSPLDVFLYRATQAAAMGIPQRGLKLPVVGRVLPPLLPRPEAEARELETRYPAAGLVGELTGAAAPIMGLGGALRAIPLLGRAPTLVREAALGATYVPLERQQYDVQTVLEGALMFPAFNLVLKGLGKFVAKPILQRISKGLESKTMTPADAAAELSGEIDRAGVDPNDIYRSLNKILYGTERPTGEQVAAAYQEWSPELAQTLTRKLEPFEREAIRRGLKRQAAETAAMRRRAELIQRRRAVAEAGTMPAEGIAGEGFVVLPERKLLAAPALKETSRRRARAAVVRRPGVMPEAEGIPTRPKPFDSIAEGRRIDALDPNTEIWVFHATDTQTAGKFLKSGIKIKEKPRTVTRAKYERGEYAEFAPSRGLARGLTVGRTPQGVSGYGRQIIAVRVKLKDIVPSPEAEALGNKTRGHALAVDDAQVITDIPATKIRLVDKPGEYPGDITEYPELTKPLPPGRAELDLARALKEKGVTEKAAVLPKRLAEAEGVAKDLQRITTEVKAIQTAFLKDKGLTWEEVRSWPKERQTKLQQEYTSWLAREKPAPQPPAAKAKEPWEMTREEYVRPKVEERLRRGGIGAEDAAIRIEDAQKKTHEQIVRAALHDRKPVPEHVLAEYPELGKAAAGFVEAKPLSNAELKTLANEMLNEAKYISKPSVRKGARPYGVQVHYGPETPEWYTRTPLGKREVMSGLKAIIKDGYKTRNPNAESLLSLMEEWAVVKKGVPRPKVTELVAGELRKGDRVRIGEEWYTAKPDYKSGEVDLVDSRDIKLDVFDRLEIDEIRPVAGKPLPATGAMITEAPPGQLAGVRRMLERGEVREPPPEQIIGGTEKAVRDKVVPSVEQSSDLPKYAGNLNLYRVDVDDQIKRAAVELAEQIPRRRYTLKEIEADAKDLLAEVPPDLIQKLAKEYGEDYLAKHVTASRTLSWNLFTSLTENWSRIADRASKQGIDSLNKEELGEAFSLLQNYLKGQFAATSAFTGSIGRALSAHRIKVAPGLKWNQIKPVLEGIADGSIEQKGLLEKLFSLKHPQEIVNFANQLTNPRWRDYVWSIYYNSLLSGPPTHLVNSVSNEIFHFWQYPVEAVRAAIDVPLSRIQRRPREYFLSEIVPGLLGTLRGTRRGTAAFFQMLTKGEVGGELTKFQREMGQAYGAFARSKSALVRKVVSPAMEWPTRLLGASDMLARGQAYYKEIEQLALRHAMKDGLAKKLKGAALKQHVAELSAKYSREPTEAMMRQAKFRADYTTFQDAPGYISGALIRLRDKVPFGRAVMPFVNTIGNLLKRGAELTPGLGVFVQRQQLRGAQLSEVLAKQTLGAAGAVSLFLLYGQGLLTGAAPKNKGEREQWYRMGKQPWSLKIGNTWVSYRRLEPFNTVIAAVTSAADAVRDKKRMDLPPDAVGARIVSSLARNLLDASYLSGFSDLLRAIETGERTWSYETLIKWPARAVSGFVPFSSLGRSLVKAGETLEHPLRGEATVRRPIGWRETIAAQYPGAAQRIRPRLTVWGEPAKIPGGWLRQWLPWKARAEKLDPVETEIARLAEAGYMGYPAEVTKKIKGVELNMNEWQTYQRVAGQYAKPRLDKLVRLPIYRRMSNEARAKEIKRIINKGRELARERLWRYLLQRQRVRVREALKKE